MKIKYTYSKETENAIKELENIQCSLAHFIYSSLHREVDISVGHCLQEVSKRLLKIHETRIPIKIEIIHEEGDYK